MAGYTRQSSADIVATAVVRANPLNLEFDQVLAAFNASTGHKHDGTTAEGAYVPLIADSDALNKVSVDTSNNRVGVFVEVSSAAVEQIRIQDGVITPVTDNDIDLGTSSVEFKDLYLDGTATIDTLQVDESATITANLTVNGNTTLGNAASDTVTVTADVASPLLPSADDTHDLGAVGSEWRNLYIDGTANIDALVADTADINGGTIDGATIGGSSAGAGTFTTLAATSLSLGGTAVTSTAAELNILDGVTSTATELNILDGVTATTAELNIMDGVTATTAELNIMDGVTSTAAELNILDGVTSTTAELNILDGVTSTTAELNKLDGATVTVSEINILDGDTSATSTTVADADRVVMNDNGTMVQVAMTDLAAYLDDEITAMPNLVTTAATTVGALNAGSITSGFGTIDTGSSTITTTGNITGGNIIISDGGNIGSTSDTDAIAITSGGNVTLSQNLTVTGNLQVDGTTTTVNSANMTVDDKLIELGNGRTGSASGDAGIVIERGDDANAFIGFDESANKFTVGTGTFTGASTGDLTITTGTLVANIEGNVTGAVTGNASTATALATARTIAGQSFDGTANITIAPTDLTGVNATATELNIMDGGTSATSTTLADADRVVVNDAGTMKQVALTDFETYFESALDTLGNVTTVGALNSGSITSGFGSIDNGSSAITTTGTITYGSLSDGSITITGFVDEDDMSSNSATLIPTQQSVEARIQSVNATANNVTGLNATGAELNTVADFSAVSVDTSTAIASNDAILMFDNGNEIGYRDVDLLDTYFSATTKTLTNKTLTSPIVSGLQLSDSGFSVEGSSADANETTVAFTNPSADRTITFPNATGNVAVFATAPTTAITDGSAGQFLKTDGSGALSFAAAGADLYVANPSSATDPTASGANAVAIGDAAVASNTDALAIGSEAAASASNSIAIGHISIANTESATALGYNSEARSTYATALGRGAYAGGFASTSVGHSTYAGGSSSTALGRGSSATHTNSTAIGYNATTSANNQVAIGDSTATVRISETYNLPSSDGTNGQVLTTNGSGAVTFADAGGGAFDYTRATKTANYTVVAGDLGKIIDVTSNSVTISLTAAATLGDGFYVYIRNSSSTSTHVVTIDGNGSETIDGSPLIYLRRNEGIHLVCDGSGFFSLRTRVDGLQTNLSLQSHQNDQPTASGSQAIALGGQTDATANFATAIGYQAEATHSGAIALGYDSSALGSNAVSIGSATVVTASAGGVAIGGNAGYSTKSEADHAVAIGTMAKAAGSGSFSGPYSYSSGNYSVSMGIANGSTSYGATGANSIAIGQQAKATGTASVKIGRMGTIAGDYSVGIGNGGDCTSNATFSVALQGTYLNASNSLGFGSESEVQSGHDRSIVLGRGAKSRTKGGVHFGGYNAISAGQNQAGIYILASNTTDATAEALTTNNSTASTDNQIILPNESAMSFTGTVVVREDASDGDDYAGWEIKGVIMRQGQESDTALGVGIVNDLYHTAGLANAAVALSADTTNGGLKIQVTGIASTNLNWVATVHTSEVVNT